MPLAAPSRARGESPRPAAQRGPGMQRGRTAVREESRCCRRRARDSEPRNRTTSVRSPQARKNHPRKESSRLRGLSVSRHLERAPTRPRASPTPRCSAVPRRRSMDLGPAYALPRVLRTRMSSATIECPCSASQASVALLPYSRSPTRPQTPPAETNPPEWKHGRFSQWAITAAACAKNECTTSSSVSRLGTTNRARPVAR